MKRQNHYGSTTQSLKSACSNISCLIQNDFTTLKAKETTCQNNKGMRTLRRDMRNTNKEEKEDIKGMISELLKGQLEINQDLLIKMSKPVKI